VNEGDPQQVRQNAHLSDICVLKRQQHRSAALDSQMFHKRSAEAGHSVNQRRSNLLATLAIARGGIFREVAKSSRLLQAEIIEKK